MATSAFGKAFAAARKAGKKVFDWNGKSYNTKLANPLKTSDRPASRPSASPASTPKPQFSNPDRQAKADKAVAKEKTRRAIAKNSVKKSMEKSSGSNFR